MINILRKGLIFTQWAIVLLLCLIITNVSNVFAWSRTSHHQMAYWAAKHRGWLQNMGPFATMPLEIKWDAKINTSLLPAIPGKMWIDKTITYSYFKKEYSEVPSTPNWTGLEIIQYWSAIADPIDEPTAIVKGGLFAHMYTPTFIGFADDMCQDFFNLAIDTYPEDKGRGLAYLGMAIHYLEDMGIPIHCECDYLNPQQMSWQILAHGKSESWVNTNWYTYFDAAADSAGQNPLPVCDVAAAARALALASAWDIEAWKATYGHVPQNPDYPAKQEEFIKVVRRCIKRTVPRIAGLLDYFAFKVGIK